MKPGLPWQVSGVRREARDTAREAAHRAGMSVGEWLDSVILESAQAGDEQPEAQLYRCRARDRDPQADERRHDYGRRTGDEAYGEDAVPPRQERDWAHNHPDARNRFEYEEGRDPGRTRHYRDQAADVFEQAQPAAQDSPATRAAFADLNARLDRLTRQLDRVAQISASNAAPPRSEEPPRQLIEVISKLDHRLDQLIAEGRTTKTEIEHRVNAVGRAVADLNRESRRDPGKGGSAATPLDHALAEIADRQRALDGYGSASTTAQTPRQPGEAASLPRPRTQDLSGLEQQLRQVNEQIENLKPCSIEKAVDTLRNDLAEIGVMLQDAMPRKSVEAIEREMCKLSERIEQSRDAGADGAALAGVERGLAEVRDAVRQLTPAEKLGGVDRELHQLSQKIDQIAHKSQDPAALRQLDGTIASLRGIVSQVASNDALASLSDEVRALSGKVDHAARSSSDNVLNALEGRISVLADALAARNQSGQSVPHEPEAVLKSLADKIERVQLSRGDQAALGHLEDRIAKLVEKLDASDARLNHLEAIERGLAELLIHFEHQRLPNLARPGSPPPEVEELTQDLADLRQTEKRTQESLELVHGTLGHVVDRLATIETDMRSSRERGGETARSRAGAPNPVRAPKADPAPAAPAGKKSNAQQAEAKSKSEAHGGSGERPPIDPTLPPDQPLEPGSSRRPPPPGSAAERIAASEEALADAKPPVDSDAGGKTNFIAAARRAAQAASREAPAKGASSGPKEIASAAGKLASRVGRLRALIEGSAGVLLVLGSLQIAKTVLTSSEETVIPTPPSETLVGIAAGPADPAVVPAAVAKEPAAAEQTSSNPAPAEPSVSGRQSSALSPASRPTPPAPSVPVTPLEIARQASAIPAISVLPATPAATPAIPVLPASAATPVSAAGEHEVTESIPPASIPAPGTNAATRASPTVVQPPAAASPADKLPSAFGPTLRAAAAKGDASAQYEIAVRYAEGRGVAQNLTEAAEWFERAAKQGIVPAQFRLGGLYEKGLGVKKNLDTARRFYAAAGIAGHAKALHHLAVIYAEGIDGKPDYQTAARWFRKAADYGVADSQYNLAILYARGIGVEQNITEAYRWFALAAREGDWEAAKKRDELGARLDPQSVAAAIQAVNGWTPQSQPDAAEQVKTPPGGWDHAAVTPLVPAKRKPLNLGPKLDLATPRVPQ
jgi:localization factor PodJL